MYCCLQFLIERLQIKHQIKKKKKKKTKTDRTITYHHALQGLVKYLFWLLPIQPWISCTGYTTRESMWLLFTSRGFPWKTVVRPKCNRTRKHGCKSCSSGNVELSFRVHCYSQGSREDISPNKRCPVWLISTRSNLAFGVITEESQIVQWLYSPCIPPLPTTQQVCVSTC